MVFKAAMLVVVLFPKDENFIVPTTNTAAVKTIYWLKVIDN